MTHKKLFVALALIALVAMLSLSHAPTSAKLAAAYELTWYTVDSGGATFSTGGTYSLGGTVGQADAGALSGGTYTLAGGFWGEFFSRLFLPLILKNP